MSELFLNLLKFCGVVIQVFVIAFLYYRWLRLMRNSASIFAFSSFLVVVGILSTLSFLVQMPVLNAICRYLLLQMPLLLIVLFQNDIRRAFTRYALFFRNFFSKKMMSKREGAFEALIAELVETVCTLTTLPVWREHLKTIYTVSAERNRHLLNRNTGALIALQGNEYCLSYIPQFVKMDCAVESMLLRTIFYVGTPLHDGGIVIDKRGRIIAAGCLFPQYSNYHGNQRFTEGAHTRHNAALGLCHQLTDCLVIVISEETGSVSVCLSQDRKTPIAEVVNTPQRLIEVLRKHYNINIDHVQDNGRLHWLWRFIGGLNRK